MNLSEINIAVEVYLAYCCQQKLSDFSRTKIFLKSSQEGTLSLNFHQIHLVNKNMQYSSLYSSHIFKQQPREMLKIGSSILQQKDIEFFPSENMEKQIGISQCITIQSLQETMLDILKSKRCSGDSQIRELQEIQESFSSSVLIFSICLYETFQKSLWSFLKKEWERVMQGIQSLAEISKNEKMKKIRILQVIESCAQEISPLSYSGVKYEPMLRYFLKDNRFRQIFGIQILLPNKKKDKIETNSLYQETIEIPQPKLPQYNLSIAGSQYPEFIVHSDKCNKGAKKKPLEKTSVPVFFQYHFYQFLKKILGTNFVLILDKFMKFVPSKNESEQINSKFFKNWTRIIGIFIYLSFKANLSQVDSLVEYFQKNFKDGMENIYQKEYKTKKIVEELVKRYSETYHAVFMKIQVQRFTSSGEIMKVVEEILAILSEKLDNFKLRDSSKLEKLIRQLGFHSVQ